SWSCPESAPQTGTGKSPFESAQKTTAVCANREIFGFDCGEAGGCTAILTNAVEGSFTKLGSPQRRARVGSWQCWLSCSRCHAPRRRGIQYAAVSRLNR